MNTDPTDLEYLRALASRLSPITPKALRVQSMIRHYEARQQAHEREMREFYQKVTAEIDAP